MIIYDGPSELDGAPIVCVLTSSTNRKTGDMLQTWIMRSDVPPLQASRDGLDASVCGDCPHRWHLGGACYVNLGRAPTAVWQKFARGGYPTKNPLYIARGRVVRVGSYGNPSAVPAYVWEALLTGARGWTAYEHLSAELAPFAMMSVDSPEQASEAAEQGLRYFRVGPPGSSPAPNEVLCPASEEAGKKTTCAECLLCGGTRPDDKRRSVFIPAHGLRKGRLNVIIA